MDDTVLQLQPDPEQPQLWQKQKSERLSSINESSRTLYSLELEGLRKERDTLSLGERFEVLVLSALFTMGRILHYVITSLWHRNTVSAARSSCTIS